MPVRAVVLDVGETLIDEARAWGVTKPEPGFYSRLVQMVGLPAGEIAYVGDPIDNDVVPAVEAGLVSVFIRRGPWGFVHAGWPEVALARIRIESLAELPHRLASMQ